MAANDAGHARARCRPIRFQDQHPTHLRNKLEQWKNCLKEYCMEFVLEKFGPQDFDDYFRLVSDSKVMAMITERAIALDEARADYEKLLNSNNIHPEFGQFKILAAQGGHFIGLAKLEVSDANATTAELGYMILPEYWGQGIAGLNQREGGVLVCRTAWQAQARKPGSTSRAARCFA